MPTVVPKKPLAERAAVGVPLALLLLTAFIVGLDNHAFWSAALRATAADDQRVGVLLALGAILACPPLIVLSLAAGRWTLKVVGAALLLTAALCGYFMSEYGIVVDTSMIRNIVETEVREASPLLTTSFYVHLGLFGVVPALLWLALPIRALRWRRDLYVRASIVVVSVLATTGTVYANYGAVSFFAREHSSMRLLMNPGYPIHSLARFYLHDDQPLPPHRQPLVAHIDPAYRARAKPTLLVFVAGETARADRFSLNGYARDTNRYTRPLDVVSFANVSSCGTSTAESVPCLFSGLGREQFTHEAAAQRESLFGTLGRLGTRVFWRDNSTGCKAVCEPSQFEQFAARTDPELCDATGCFDEILLADIDELVAGERRDHFIVLHQRGSHGPAYHTDTPAWSKAYLPECDLAALRNCSRDLINNAYDNTILYSDYFLARVIDFLERHSDEYEVAMLYVSDHGESLGENGLYLHGFPYAIAPPEQTRVPMLFWASPGFYARNGIGSDCVRATSGRELSHDWIYHTIIPLLGLDTPSYREDLDVFAACRAAPEHLSQSGDYRESLARSSAD